MNCLVTGVAGFIGSHLARALINRGDHVTGVDMFTDYYEKNLKETNIEDLYSLSSFTLLKRDVAELTTEELSEIDLVFHQAAQAGVRKSWGRQFDAYTHHNILATQKLLETCRNVNIKKFIYASSSSVYGEIEKLPVTENTCPKPVSPYGVSKLAGEHLVDLYYYNYKVPTVSLRYFTVYGPGQRPDMAFRIFINSIFEGRPLQIYGDGNQTRDVTYIDDVVAANLMAVDSEDVEGRVFNIGGGSQVSINEVIAMLERITGFDAQVDYYPPQKGDPYQTFADVSLARQYLGFSPQVQLEEGLKQQIKSLGYKLNY